jgi:nucleotide-binding universal stress UspA family protein
VEVQGGDIAEIVMRHARARRPDLIVLGSSRDHDPNGLPESIAERVLRDVPCATFVVPASSVAESPLLENILCAVDFSPSSESAAREAARLSTYRNRRVTLFHVVDRPGPDEYLHYPWLVMQEYHRQLAAAALGKLRDRIPVANHGAVLARVSVGPPVTEILREARAVDAQLLVIGARPRRLIGKTSRLLRKAACPVLAVPVCEEVVASSN